MDSLKGKILVASPQLPDPNFYHSIVLVIEHDEDGAFGLIVNRTTRRKLNDIWEQISGARCPTDVKIAIGGPIEGPLLALHGHPDHADFEVVPGVYLARSAECLQSLFAQDKFPCRVFIGYSGWASGQLDNEMKTGSWLTVSATRDLIFDSDEDFVWDQAVQEISNERARDFFKVRHVAEDPSMN